MATCHYCRRTFDPQPPGPRASCPYCQSEWRDPQEDGWVSVARVASLAEVGFFEDLLSRAQIESAIHERDDFDAVSGIWDRTYVVQVPADHADAAAQLMQQELEGSSETEATERVIDGSDANAALRRSMALVLVAGGLAYWGGRGAMELWREQPARGAQAAPHQRHDALWEALCESDEPFVTLRPNGDPQRVLRYDAHSDAVLLEEDLNGDGRYDRRRVFRQRELTLDERR